MNVNSVTELEDESSSTQTAERTTAWFEAPNKVRMERRGSQGTLLVSEGLVPYFLSVAADRYVKGGPYVGDFFPGLFLPNYGTLGGVTPPFLFARIAENVASAEIAVAETDNLQISVAYQPQPADARWWLSSPVRYSIDSGTGLLTQIEGEGAVRMSPRDATTISKHRISFSNSVANASLPPNIFKFTPLPNAMETDPRRRTSMTQRVDSFDFIKANSEQVWDGDTLVERQRLFVHGSKIRVERRLRRSPRA